MPRPPLCVDSVTLSDRTANTDDVIFLPQHFMTSNILVTMVPWPGHQIWFDFAFREQFQRVSTRTPKFQREDMMRKTVQSFSTLGRAQLWMEKKKKKKEKCVAQLLKLHSRHFRSVLRADSASVGVRSVSCYTVAGVGRIHSCLSAFQE